MGAGGNARVNNPENSQTGARGGGLALVDPVIVQAGSPLL